MAGEENLIPLNQRTKEEQREIASKGGKASVEARRRKKTMRENLEILLSMPLKPGKGADIDNAENMKDFSKENVTVEQAMLMAQIQKALKGDIYAFEAVRDLIGERPVNKTEVSADVKTENPFDGLTTDELKKLIADDKG
jgi:hypothetical protein|nr:MAG TPA: hypothetical protein [Caudoviricetes sp.]